MDSVIRRGHLTLIPGGLTEPEGEPVPGPVTRLRGNVPVNPLSQRQVVVLILGKVALLAAALYFIYGK